MPLKNLLKLQLASTHKSTISRSNRLKGILVGGAVLLLPISMSAQTPGSAQREAMKKLDFLVGQWKGDAWVEFGPGQRHKAIQTESVQMKLDGLLLLIEGLGKESGVTVHNALAVVSHDLKTGQYRIRAYRGDGAWIDADTKLTPGALEWGFQDPRAGTIRFTIKIESGRWNEIGEASRDGKTWHKFLEMNLERVN
jgi:hypothetical protein